MKGDTDFALFEAVGIQCLINLEMRFSIKFWIGLIKWLGMSDLSLGFRDQGIEGSVLPGL